MDSLNDVVRDDQTGISWDSINDDELFDSITGDSTFDSLEDNFDNADFNSVNSDTADTAEFDSLDDEGFDSIDESSEINDNIGLVGADEDFDANFDNIESEADNASDYLDGAIVEDNLLEEDENTHVVSNMEADFISDTGSIVVQDAYDDKENGFELIYLDIEQIAITNRIRKMASVDALVKSIQSTGLLKPLTVAPTATEGLYVLLDGYRRIQACARAGKTRVPCIVNNRVSTPEIPILEAMYNHAKLYNIREQIDYIDYLEKQKGIMNPTMIEYLLQMESGDYTKLKDLLNDNDDDILDKLFSGVWTISAAFKKLEQRRRKESAEEKENKKANKVYEDEKKSGADQIEGSGEEADGEALTEEQIKNLAFNVDSLEDTLESMSITEMIDEDKNIEGFEPHKQKVGEREYIDPIIKKTVMARDNSTCRCCRRGGEQYVDILDFHHVIPVFLGGSDTPENGIMLCVACHRLVHLYSTGDLHIDSALLNNNYSQLTDVQKERFENEEIFEDEKRRFKTIIYLGSKIRQGIAQKGMNREQYKKEHSNASIGRRKPGKNSEQEKA